MDLQRIIDRDYIPESEINIKLMTLYESNWDSYIINIKDKIEAAYPFLISVSNKYINAPIKILIYGQETQVWGGEFYELPEYCTIKNLMALYDLFINQDFGYNSPYWRFIRAIVENSNDNIGISISNIVRIGKKYDAGCNLTINNLSLEFFNVIKEELKILQPDIIFFLTGPFYDNRIKEALGNFSERAISKEYSLRQFAQLIFEEKTMPPTFRCYHPGYIQRKKWTPQYINTILQIIADLNNKRI